MHNRVCSHSHKAPISRDKCHIQLLEAGSTNRITYIQHNNVILTALTASNHYLPIKVVNLYMYFEAIYT